MFNLDSLLDPKVLIPLRVPPDRLKALFRSVSHEKFRTYWRCRFHVTPDNMTNRASLGWLAQYCANGGSSRRYARDVRIIFDEIFPFTYLEFEQAGFVERSRPWRYRRDRRFRDIDNVLASTAEFDVDAWDEELIEEVVTSFPAHPEGDLRWSAFARRLAIRIAAIQMGLQCFWTRLKRKHE